MGRAIGMVELSSIARGIETSDSMLKAAQVELLRSVTVCPGKYMVIVGGDTGAVRASLEAGKAAGGEFVVDTLLIPSVHEQVFPAISGTVEVTDPQAVGVIEYYSIASAIEAADAAAKAAQITLIEVRTGYAIGGKTATSQTLPRSNGRYIASFIGFAPAQDPQVLALVIIHDPQGIYYGGTIAAPVVRELFENILPYLGIEKSEDLPEPSLQNP